MNNAVTDPFDEPLEDSLILNDTFFAAARDVITVDGMEYSFLKPPYMNFDDHVRTKRKLREAYSQHEFLLLYGYSGCGKTTVLTQFSEKYPEFIHGCHCIFSRITFAGLPATSENGKTSCVTTEPAATTAPSPMVTPFKIRELHPIHTFFPMTTGAVCSFELFIL